MKQIILSWISIMYVLSTELFNKQKKIIFERYTETMNKKWTILFSQCNWYSSSLTNEN